MRRFRFPLQRALGVRRRQEDALRVVLATALGDWRRASARLGQAEAARRGWQAELAERQRRGLPVAEWLAALDGDRVLASRVDAARRQVEQAAARAERARGAYVAARQRAEALERLRSRRLELHQLAAAWAEQNELEEAAGSRQDRNPSKLSQRISAANHRR